VNEDQVDCNEDDQVRPENPLEDQHEEFEEEEEDQDVQQN